MWPKPFFNSIPFLYLLLLIVPVKSFDLNVDYFVSEHDDLSNMEFNELIERCNKMILYYNSKSNHKKNSEANQEKPKIMRDLLHEKPSKINHKKAIEILSRVKDNELIFHGISAICDIDMSLDFDTLNEKNKDIGKEIDFAFRLKEKLSQKEFDQLLDYLFGPIITEEEYESNVDHQYHFEEISKILPSILNHKIETDERKLNLAGKVHVTDLLSDRINLYKNTLKSNCRYYKADPYYPKNTCITTDSKFYRQRERYKIIKNIKTTRLCGINDTSVPITMTLDQIKSNATLITKYLGKIFLVCSIKSNQIYTSDFTIKKFFSLLSTIFQGASSSSKQVDLMGNASFDKKMESYYNEAVTMAFRCQNVDDTNRKPRPLLKLTCYRLHNFLLNKSYEEKINKWRIYIELLKVLKNSNYTKYFDFDDIAFIASRKFWWQCDLKIGNIIEVDEKRFEFIADFYNPKPKYNFELKYLSDLENSVWYVDKECFIHSAVQGYNEIVAEMDQMVYDLWAIQYMNIHSGNDDDEDQSLSSTSKTVKIPPVKLDFYQQVKLIRFISSQMRSGLEDYDFHHNIIAAIYGSIINDKMGKYHANTLKNREEKEEYGSDELCATYDLQKLNKFRELVEEFDEDNLKQLDITDEYIKARDRYTIKSLNQGNDDIKHKLKKYPYELFHLLLSSNFDAISLYKELERYEVSEKDVNELHAKMFENIPASFFDTDESLPMIGCAFGPNKNSIRCNGSTNTKKVTETLLKLDLAIKDSLNFQKYSETMEFINIPLKCLPEFMHKWAIKNLTLNGVLIDVDCLKNFNSVSKLNLINILSPTQQLPGYSEHDKYINEQRICLNHLDIHECLTNPQNIGRSIIIKTVPVQMDQGIYEDKISNPDFAACAQGQNLKAYFFQKPINIQFAIEMSTLADLNISNVYLDLESNALLTKNLLRNLLNLKIEDYHVISHVDLFCTENVKIIMDGKWIKVKNSCFCTEDQDLPDLDEENDENMRILLLKLKNNMKTIVKVFLIFLALAVFGISMTLQNPNLFADMAVYDKGSLFGNRVEYTALKLTNLQYKKFFAKQNISEDEVMQFEADFQAKACEEEFKRQKIKSILKAANRYTPEPWEKSDDHDDVDQI